MRKFEPQVASHRRVHLVALVDVVAQRIGVVFFEVVNHRHQPLCRLLVLNLRESIAEVVKSGGVKRSYMR